MPRRQKCHFAPRPLLWLKAPKLTLLTVGEKYEKELNELGGKCKEDEGTLRRTLSETKGMRPRRPERSRNFLCETFVKPWWNLGETLGTFGQPKTDLPQRARDTTKLEEP